MLDPMCKNFITNYVGVSNFSSGISDAVGFSLLIKAQERARNYVQSQDITLETMTSKKVVDAWDARRPYIAAAFLPLAYSVWNVIEAVSATLIGLFFLGQGPITQNQFLNLAKRSIIRMIVNIPCAVTGLIGIFSPKQANELITIGLGLVHEIDSTFTLRVTIPEAGHAVASGVAATVTSFFERARAAGEILLR